MTHRQAGHGKKKKKQQWRYTLAGRHSMTTIRRIDKAIKRGFAEDVIRMLRK